MEPECGNMKNNPWMNRVEQQEDTLIQRKPCRRRKLPKSSKEIVERKGQDNVIQKAPGLQCYSCGSLLSHDVSCMFSRSNIPLGESCLLYIWRESENKYSTLKKCFSTSAIREILLRMEARIFLLVYVILTCLMM